MARWSVGPNGQRRIVMGLTPNHWVVLIGILTGGGTAYGSLATEEYVNTKVDSLAVEMKAMAKAQADTAKDVAAVKAQADIMVRLGTAQYAREERRHAAEAYEAEVRHAKRRRMPEPARPRPNGPAAKAARRLKVDPDDPLQGVPMPDG